VIDSQKLRRRVKCIASRVLVLIRVLIVPSADLRDQIARHRSIALIRVLTPRESYLIGSVVFFRER